MKRLCIIFSILLSNTYVYGSEQHTEEDKKAEFEEFLLYKKEKNQNPEFAEFLRYKKEKEKEKQKPMVFGGGYSGQNFLDLSNVNRTQMNSNKASNFWNGELDFKTLDKMVGYLWCEINGRLVMLQTSGSQVSNIFAELQRRCLVRKGKPVAFAIRLRDF